MKHVVLIFTGGTISMKVSKTNDGVIPSLSPNEIVSSISGIEEFDNIIVEEFARKPSPAITPRDMKALARLTQSYLNRDDVAGVVVVHGTDVLEETAFYLNCVVDSLKPIVVTGSMKNASELGYDGLTNLVSSIKVCLSEQSKEKGTLVVLNDSINSALEVVKSHTLSLDTFKSLEFGPLGIIDYNEVIYYREIANFKKYQLGNEINDSTYLIKTYAGMDGSFIEYLLDRQAQGIVIEALGRGNLPPEFVETIGKAINMGVYIVIVSRCPSGRVLDTYGYEGGGKQLTEMGCILGGSLNGQKARILLMLAISNEYTYEEIKDLFAQ
ncbi:MAG: asparaginase [Candidatus Izimaplasma sp.]|nr:asparaginase [Candidatus Izimaplasma bacterium]